jgi:hypothetical protein
VSVAIVMRQSSQARAIAKSIMQSETKKAKRNVRKRNAMASASVARKDLQSRMMMAPFQVVAVIVC